MIYYAQAVIMCSRATQVADYKALRSGWLNIISVRVSPMSALACRRTVSSEEL